MLVHTLHQNTQPTSEENNLLFFTQYEDVQLYELCDLLSR